MNRNVNFQIHGNEMQYIEIGLEPQEGVIAEAGSLMMMEDGIQMETVFGDGSQRGFMEKLIGAGKRWLAGESLFMTEFTNRGYGKKRVAFAAPYAGKIIPLDLRQYGGKMVCQKDAFLCATKGVSIGIEFQRRLGAGFFGGEGFIMEKLEGDGVAFIHAGGTIYERELLPGEVLRLHAGNLVALTQGVTYDIEFVGGIKTALFGGEGLFFATLRGPGHVWVQSLPLSRLADHIISASPLAGGWKKEEGGFLGGWFDGD
jgi:uncharacterized protein (TIGR00266 family)